MTTAAEKRELRSMLAREGKLEFFYNPPPKVQYYTAAGNRLPNLLPGDPFSMSAYLKKGFTLTPGGGGNGSSAGTVKYPETAVGAGRKGVDEPVIQNEDFPQTSQVSTRGRIPDPTPAFLSKLYRDMAEGKLVYTDAPPVEPEIKIVGYKPAREYHVHRYAGKKLGAPCKAEGCEAVRKVEFKKQEDKPLKGIKPWDRQIVEVA